MAISTGCASDPASTPSASHSPDSATGSNAATLTPSTARDAKDEITSARAQLADSVIRLWAGSDDPLPEVFGMLPAAVLGCPEAAAGSEAAKGLCASAMVLLAEEELARADEEYERYIARNGEIRGGTQFHIDKRAEWREVNRVEREAWRRYRDATCTLVAFHYLGGSGAGRAATDCVLDLTQQRLRALRGDSDESTFDF